MKTKLIATLVSLSIASNAGASFSEPVPMSRYLGARIDRDADLVAAQMCAGETGVARPGWLEGCVIQVAIIARRAAQRGVSFSTHARAYSSALKYPRNRPWLLELDRAGSRPASWGATRASWTRYRARWLRLLWVVRSQLAGDVPDTCPEADHFGSVQLDGWRADAAGWSRVCSNANERQGFYER